MARGYAASVLALSQVIYAVRDLDAAARAVSAVGLTVIDGGRHPGLGTANRIVPLGDQYFELLGVVDAEEAAHSAFGRAVLDSTSEHDRLVRWSLRCDDIDAVARTRALEPERHARRRPDGQMLTWRAAGLDRALREGWLPFFMQWDDPAHYPGAAGATHVNGARGVAWLELAPGDVGRLHTWLGESKPPLRLVDGPPGLRRVALDLGDGEPLVIPDALVG